MFENTQVWLGTMISRNSSTLTLKGLNLAYDMEERVGFRLMTHQAELRKSGGRLIFLDVPTGGGKTLACLLRVLETDGDAMFLYPTNELVVDQASQLDQALERAGHRTKVVGISPLLGRNQDIPAQVTLAVINRQSFENIAPGKPHGVALDHLLSGETGRLILLTNPDTLFALVQSRYRRSGFLWKHLKRFRTLIIDEFHLYYGVALAHILYLLWCLRGCFDQIIFSSATASDVQGLLSSCFREPDIIRASFTVSGGRPVRWQTTLELRHAPMVLGTSDGRMEDKQFLLTKILQFYEQHRANPAPVKVLAIVNSVVFAEELYRALRDQLGAERVSAIHGFVPMDQRTFRDVVIGTSAIEIGVDFDVASLIFEARDSSAFIQRLGRGGRHRPCDALGIVPTGSYEALSARIHDIQGPDGVCEYLPFLALVRKTLDPLPSHSEFITSAQGMQLLLALIYQIIKGVERGERGIWNKVRQELGQDFFIPPVISQQEIQEQMQKSTPSFIEALAQSAFRGHILSLPAYYEEYGTSGEISIFDLWKLDFELLGETPPMVRINGIAPAVRSWKLILSNPWSPRLGVLRGGNFSVVPSLGDPRFESMLTKLLEGVPYYLCRERPDWRLPFVREARTDKLVYLGAGALLAAYLDSR